MSIPSRLPLIAAIAAIAASCVSCSARTRCTITNNSTETLRQVVVSGSSFSSPVADLTPGAARTVSLAPRGEQGAVSVAFRVQGREFRHTAPLYFEATGYDLRVTVSPDLQITIEAGVYRPGPSRAAPRGGIVE